MEPKEWALIYGYELKTYLSILDGACCEVVRRMGPRSVIVCKIENRNTEAEALEDAIIWIKNYERITL